MCYNYFVSLICVRELAQIFSIFSLLTVSQEQIEGVIMLYQKLMVGKNSYFVSVGANSNGFEVHRHPELELSFCFEGEYDIVIDNTKYTLKKGDLAMVRPMAAHEVFSSKTEDTRMLIVDVGPGFLGQYFSMFVNFDFVDEIYRLGENDSEAYTMILATLNEIAELKVNDAEFSDLMIKGHLYKLCALMLKHFPKGNSKAGLKKNLQDILKIEKSLELIYSEYATRLSIDYVCEICGYSRSNFCKIFKNITGNTFHNVLNDYRVEISCIHLKESNASVEEIAAMVGFTDVQGYCRVFKKNMGISPGAYRRQHKK